MLRILTLLVPLFIGCQMDLENSWPQPPAPDESQEPTTVPDSDEEWTPADTPVDEPSDEPPVDEPAGDDPAEEDPPERPVDPPEDPEDPVEPPDDEPPSGGLSGAGGPCDCDSDCAGDTSHSGLCIHGICGARSADDSCPAGSTSSCPPRMRCWSGTGRGVCYPDFISGECAGREDSDGSCVSGGVTQCYSGCGTLCDLPGTPDESGGDVEPDPDPDPAPPAGDLTAPERDLFDALNDERAANGLPAVVVDDRLMCAARRHALDVGTTRTCEHVGSDGTWPWDRAEACGFPQDTWTVNEIAAGPGFSDGADAVWGWRHSDGHHAAIVHTDARSVGVAVHNTCFIAVFDCCVASF